MASCRALLATLILGTAVSACGQKGPLYLPDAPQKPEQDTQTLPDSGSDTDNPAPIDNQNDE